jgi:hypothetical protein
MHQILQKFKQNYCAHLCFFQYNINSSNSTIFDGQYWKKFSLKVLLSNLLNNPN